MGAARSTARRPRPGRLPRRAAAPLLIVALSAWGVAQETPPIADAVLQAVDIGAVEARTGALLLSGQQGGEVEGALTWTISGSHDDGSAELPYTVEVDGGQLLAGDRGGPIPIGIYAYLVDDDGRIVAHQAQGLRLAREVFAERLTRSGLKFLGRFQVRPGSYVLRVMVRNHANDEFYLSWSFVEVPDAEDPGLRLLPPLFPDAPEHWLVAVGAGVAPAVAVAGGPPLIPAAVPTLPENRPLEAFVPELGLRPGTRLAIHVVNRVGRTVAEPAVDTAALPDRGFRRLDIAALDLPPDTYTLILTLEDEASGEVLRRATRVEVVRGSDQRAWAAAPAGSDDASGATETAAEPRIRKRELREGYLASLAALAAGDAHAARLDLAELERLAVGGGTLKERRALTEVEQEVVQRIAAQDPSALAPVALLHRQLERGYAARGEGALAQHAREMAVTTAEDVARFEPERDFATALMVGVAVDLAQSLASGAARDLLHEVLRIDPGCAPALLSLGFSHERAAEYREAVDAYRRLVASTPGSSEGRLRLAVNLLRTGAREEGESILRGLLAGEGPGWVQRLAAHELVRQLRSTGRVEAAEVEVRAAAAAMPDDQRLLILLAAILDELGRHAAAVDAVRELPPATRGVSPRARYAEWPDLGAEVSQQRLDELARGAETDLAAALAELRK